jgi:hypothetical protein
VRAFQSSETPITVYQSSQHNIPEDFSLEGIFLSEKHKVKTPGSEGLGTIIWAL